MQTPVQPPPQSGYQRTPPGRRSPWLVIGLACGGCALLVLIIILLVANGLRDAMKHGPPPPAYVGTWNYQVGPTTRTIAIAADGTAGYRSRTAVTGARSQGHIQGFARVDEKAKTLFVGLGKLGETFRIDTPPHTANGVTEMTLDGTVFERIGEYTTLPAND